MKLIPDNFKDARWHKVSDDLSIFGIAKFGIVEEKFALVKRNHRKTFDWYVNQTRFQGNEPTRIGAQGKVDEVYSHAIKLETPQEREPKKEEKKTETPKKEESTNDKSQNDRSTKKENRES